MIGILIINSTHGRCIGQALKAASTSSHHHFEDGDTMIVNVGTKSERNSITSSVVGELPFFLLALMFIILTAKISSILQRLIKVRQTGYVHVVSRSGATSTVSSELPSRDTLSSGDALRTSRDTLPSRDVLRTSRDTSPSRHHVLRTSGLDILPSRDVLRTSRDTLLSGDVLRTHETLVSSNGMYTFVNQGDGSLCIYNNNTSRATWTSGTSSQGVGNLCLQRDGKLVLYNRDGDVEDPNAQIWSASCRRRKGTGRYKLIMEGDGNLVIYDAIHRPIWSTNTSITPSSENKLIMESKLSTRDRLHSGDVLQTNEELVSSNGMYRFVNQGDGDLCIYNTQNSKRSWASGTLNQGAGSLYMQKDGHLVLYKRDGDVVDPSAPIWSSKGKPGPGPYKLIMQDNGHLLMYDTNHKPLWASNGSFKSPKKDSEMDTLVSGDFLRPGEELSSINGMHTFVNQGDGNVCLYLNQNWTCRWASGTYNQGVGNLYLQKDGNLILYNMDGDNVDLSSPIWSSGSRRGNGQYKLIMQDDGNVVIYDDDHKPTWATNTNC